MVTNEDSDHYSHQVQTSITEKLIGDPGIQTDDIVFTTILNGGFNRNDGLGNDSRFIHSGPEWNVTANELVVEPITTDVGATLSVIDIKAYMDEVITEYGAEGGGSGEPLVIELFHSWSAEVDLTIHDLGPAFRKNARVLFGPQSLESFDGQSQLPDDYWYLEIDADDDSWHIGSTELGTAFEFLLHAGASWPSIQTGELISLELRQIAQSSHDQSHYFPRFDLFVNDSPLGTVSIPEYQIFTSSRRQNSIGFFGVGTDNSKASFDHLKLYAFDFVTRSNLENLLPSAPTPKDFSQSNTPVRLGLNNNFGSADGHSLDTQLLGIDYGGAAYRIESNGAFSMHSNPADGNMFIDSAVHYADIPKAVHGSAWNIQLLTGGDDHVWDSFANAFVHAFKQDVIRQNLNVVGDSEIVTEIVPTYDPVYPAGLTYEVTFVGNGNAEAFDLRFLENNEPLLERGRIPVFANANYGHDFVVQDAEADEPYTILFDPNYVDESGNVINHNAILVDSGRSNLRSDRLIWDVPQVTTETDFHFRVLVRDNAGQLGRKNWTVSVSPWNANNQPPAINISGLTIDPDNNDGLVGEPELPNMQELRGYQYQVIATDPNVEDQDRLRYFLKPTVLDDGTIVPIPDWLTIDYHTGLVSGRAGTHDLGKTHFTVMVSDGRLYYPDPANQNIIDHGHDLQSFAITVDPRGHFNTAPFIDPIPDFVVRPDESFIYQIEASDNDADALTYKIIFGPPGMTVGRQSGLLAWTPTSEQVGDLLPVTIAVHDGAASTNATFEIIVSPANRDPVWNPNLPDGFTFRDYEHELVSDDADGNVVRF